MTTFLSRYTDLIYAMFRFMIGALFAFHGLQKMFGYPGREVPYRSGVWAGWQA